MRKRIFGSSVVVGLFLGALAIAEGDTTRPDALTQLELLPRLREGVQTKQFCSYDRSGDNYDWEYFPLYIEPNGECVIFDSMGPGCLYRQQMNVWHGGAFGPNGFVPKPLEKDMRIRYYFDDEKKPRIDMDISLFFSEKSHFCGSNPVRESKPFI